MTRLMKGLDEFLERDQDRALFDVFPWARTSRFRIMIVDTTQPSPAHRAPHAPLWRPNRSAAELSLVGTLTLSDLAPHHLEPEGQSAVMAGALSLDRSAGGVCGVMRSRSFCGVQRGERGC